MGTGIIYMFASAVYRMTERPLIIGGLAILWGWLRSALKRERRYEDLEFRKFLNRYQMRVLTIGKEKATAEIDDWNAANIQLKHE